MNPQFFGLALTLCIGVGLGVAAYKGRAMPLSACVTLIITGSLLAMAPTAFSFALQLAGRIPRFTEDERITCWVMGGTMTLVGIIASTLCRRALR